MQEWTEEDTVVARVVLVSLVALIIALVFDGHADARPPGKELRVLPEEVLSKIGNARQVASYRLNPALASNYRNQPEELKLGVFRSHPILERGHALNVGHLVILRDAVLNPKAHRIRYTRGEDYSELGFRFDGAGGRVDILVDFYEGLWSFEWVDKTGVPQQTWSYFDLVKQDILKLAARLYPQHDFLARMPSNWPLLQTAPGGGEEE